VTILDHARSLFSRVKAEGETISAPMARVTTPDNGWIPMDWGIGFWQRGFNVLPAGDNSIVEACVWAYVRAIAQLPGFHRLSLPNGGIENVTTSALSRLLRFPNAYQTQSDFLTHTVRSLLYDGNSYWLAARSGRQEAAALHWLNPRQCRPLVDENSGEVFYSVSDNPLLGAEPSGIYNGGWLIPARDILHIKLATPRHPLIGETWLTALGLELFNRGAMNMTLSAFFQNMSRPSGVLSTDTILTAWRAQSAGLNAGGVPILTAGLKWQALGISNQDSQIVEVLKLSDKTIAGVFGVPGILVGVQDQATFSSTEALMQYWLSNGLGFLLNHIEVAMDQFFGLPAAEYVEYDTDALLRANLKERIEALAQGVQGGIYAPNEARAREGYAAAKAGDEPRVQQQVVPLSFAQKAPIPAAPRPEAPPPAEPAKPDAKEEEKQPIEEAFKITISAKELKATVRRGAQNHDARRSA
jgi:HK97 family phage portal protein